MRERDLLVQSAREFLGSGETSEILFEGSSLDESLLLERALREGVAGLVALRLERLSGKGHAEVPLRPFRRELESVFARNGRLLAELSGLRRFLQQEGLEVILLKGGALVQTAYGGQLGLRPMSDLDLLIKEADRDSIREALFERGFRSPRPSSSLFSNGAAIFDLHTDLVGTGRIRRRALAARFSLEELWKEASPLDGRDGPVRVLSPYHQFLHLAVHAQKHSFARLIWLVDLALVARGVDGDTLLAGAESTGTLRTVTYAVSAMEELFGLELPLGVKRSLPRLHRAERALVAAVIERREQQWGELALVFSIPSFRAKLGYLWEYLFPERKVLSETFPSTPSWWVHARRLLQVIRRGFTESARLLRGRGLPRAR